VLGDGWFALEYWWLKPYPCDELTPKRRFFNVCLTSTGAVVECDVVFLKGRWRVPWYVVAETEIVPLVVEACVLLHNFLIDKGDEWGGGLDVAEGGSDEVHPDVGATNAYFQAFPLCDKVADLLWQTHLPASVLEYVDVQARRYE